MRFIKVKSLAVILVIALSCSLLVPMMVSAASESFDTLKTAAGDKNVLMYPEYITGGAGFGETEGSASLFDYANEDSKYCTDQLPYNAEWKYDAEYIVDRILIRTANDNEQYPRRMGDGWTLSGSNDGEEWTVIYTGSEDDVANVNFQYFYIDLPDNADAYTYYKLNADNTASDQDNTVIQLSMFVLCGEEVPVKTAREFRELTDDLNKTHKIVALGDSIAANYGVGKDQGFVAQISGILADNGIKNETINLAKHGATTADVLKLLETEKGINAVKDADAVTLSVGTTEVLNPLLNYIWALTSMANRKYYTETESPAIGNFYFTTNPSSNLQFDTTGYYASLSIAALEKAFELAMDDEAMEVINNAIDSFAADLDAIIAKIVELSPETVIYISTVYNPFDQELVKICEKIDPVIDAVNAVITAANDEESYRVVDVASTFADADRNTTGFDIVRRMYNVLPNRFGHTEIAKLYYSAMVGDYVKPAVEIPTVVPVDDVEAVETPVDPVDDVETPAE